MLKELPAVGHRPKKELQQCNAFETKESAIQRLGFEKTQAHRFEVLADNPDVIEQVKAEASGCQASA